jgi:hypothetical protein
LSSGVILIITGAWNRVLDIKFNELEAVVAVAIGFDGLGNESDLVQPSKVRRFALTTGRGIRITQLFFVSVAMHLDPILWDRFLGINALPAHDILGARTGSVSTRRLYCLADTGVSASFLHGAYCDECLVWKG